MNSFWRRAFFIIISGFFLGCALGLILGNMDEPKTTVGTFVRAK